MTFFSENWKAISTVEWKRLGEGSYNVASLSLNEVTFKINGRFYTNHWIYKQPKADEKYDKDGHIYYEVLPQCSPERAVRLWNQFYPNMPAVVAGPEFGNGLGWIAPYFGSVPASDRENAKGILDAYRQHRRIITDGCGKGNFLFFQGNARCVDFDYALSLDSPVSRQAYDEDIHEAGRPGNYSQDYHDYWAAYADSKILTVRTIYTLLYLEKSIAPHDIEDRHLTLEMVDKLREPRHAGIEASIALLDSLNPEDPIKKSWSSIGKTPDVDLNDYLDNPGKRANEQSFFLNFGASKKRATDRETGVKDSRLFSDIHIVSQAQKNNILTSLQLRRLNILKKEGCVDAKNKFVFSNRHTQKLNEVSYRLFGKHLSNEHAQKSKQETFFNQASKNQETMVDYSYYAARR